MLIIKHLQRGGYVTPNVYYVDETNGFIIKPYVKPNLCSFYLDDYVTIHTFYFKPGMTWEEFVNSSYNTTMDNGDKRFTFNDWVTNKGIHFSVPEDSYNKYEVYDSNCKEVFYTDLITDKGMYSIN